MSDFFSAVRVRYAPSPTGYLHIGGLRTVLYNWLLARRHGGTFVLRFEDTDRARYVEGSIEKMYAALEQVGLTPDEGIRVVDGQIIDEGPYAPYLQSARRERHVAYAQELIAKKFAYVCFCSKERLAELAEQQKTLKQPMMYDRHCRSLEQAEVDRRMAAGEPYVIRLAAPLEGTCVFEDEVRGRIEVPWAQIDDQVLIKTDGFPTYHLAATCDDHDMKISHVIRGEEWVSSTPKHLFIYQAMGWTPPLFAHLPLLLNPDRSKLSKRQGDVAVEEYLGKGYLPEALMNFIALMGWNPTSDREVYTMQELVQVFDLKKVNKAGAIFNLEKLRWLNAQYLRSMSVESFFAVCLPWIQTLSDDQAFLQRGCLIVRDRVEVLNELSDLIAFLFQPTLSFDLELLRWKEQPMSDVRTRLEVVRELIVSLDGSAFDEISSLDREVRAMIVKREWKNGDTLWPLRVALSGLKQSPSPFDLLFAYGRERSLERIDETLKRLP